ncbi:MAG TPA: pyridoxal phosphate-dependent aminotransferase [Polyangia bacterium]|nr:pyridoxal phosphate-dependent aminotransferase [Polyangia bacterium]
MPRAPDLSSAARALRESIFARLQGRLAPGGVPLHLGDTYLAPPESARVTAHDPSLWRYGAPAGDAVLLDALAKKLRARNRLAWAQPSNLQITCGATHALAAAARAVIDPGDEVIVPSPHWPLIRGIVSNAGGVPIEVPLTQRLYADPSLDAASLIEPLLTERTAALYVTTPNNPDGKVLAPRHLAQLAALARARGLWVLSDEVYEDLSFDAPHESIAALEGMAERTITVFSLSKSYALAGYRLGYAVAAEAPMRALRKIANHTVYNVPDVLQRAALAVVEDAASPAWLAGARATYRAARDLASSRVAAPHFLPDGATYLFVDLSRWSQGGTIWPLVEKLLDAGVSISPGEQFGRGFENHARLCFTAVPPPLLEQGLDRFARALAAR